MDDFEYDQLVLEIKELVGKIEGLPDTQVKQEVFELLKKLDLLHREGLLRILNLIETKAPRLIADIQKDFVLETLLVLYDFAQPEEAPKPVKNNGSFIPIDQLGKIKEAPTASKMPIWIPVGDVAELKNGTIKSKRTEDINVVFCKVNDQVYALQNACIDSILPLDRGKLEDDKLICPWHGCRYDVRTGEIQNGSGLRVETYPVQISQAGKISVGLNVEGE